MPDESTSTFQTLGAPWSERASFGELNAVLSPNAPPKRNLFLHGVTCYAADVARRLVLPRSTILDFGCGTGRMMRYFAARKFRVIGTEITEEMLQQTAALGIPNGCETCLTDGVHIPLP